ncbi:metalloprotease family protein [Herpetosiphon llansteffanensis]|uniref:metalloprotease family protein n=1 Tax=Herpetosiphon llansteffanensis TaxID=2094568 RepID=UPI0013DF7A13|nr:metalloprotease family protein [Herpetosiphon llansteffanensis]
MANETQPQSNIVEGLTGRLPLLIGGLVGFFGLVLFMRIRYMLHKSAQQLDFEGIQAWLIIDIVIVLIIAPLAHTLSHIFGLIGQKQPWKLQRRLLYPRVRPTQALSRRQVIGYLLAPLGLNALLLLGLLIEPLAAYFALWGAVNLGLTANDLWKVLGIWRFPQTSSFVVQQNHLERIEVKRG